MAEIERKLDTLMHMVTNMATALVPESEPGETTPKPTTDSKKPDSVTCVDLRVFNTFHRYSIKLTPQIQLHMNDERILKNPYNTPLAFFTAVPITLGFPTTTIRGEIKVETSKEISHIWIKRQGVYRISWAATIYNRRCKMEHDTCGIMAKGQEKLHLVSNMQLNTSLTSGSSLPEHFVVSAGASGVIEVLKNSAICIACTRECTGRCEPSNIISWSITAEWVCA
jgi:hypothetical protein